MTSLLGAGAAPGAVSDEGSSALHYLAISQSEEAAAAARQAQHTKLTDESFTVFHSVARLVLETGPDIALDLQDWDGFSPLMK